MPLRKPSCFDCKFGEDARASSNRLERYTLPCPQLAKGNGEQHHLVAKQVSRTTPKDLAPKRLLQ